MESHFNPYIVGVTGGSGSGKTTLVEQLVQRIGEESAVVVQQDSYYFDLSDLPPERRAEQDFDRSEAIDNQLLAEHLKKLKAGHRINVPVYDFTTHVRRETQLVEPRPLVFVEGILLLSVPILLEVIDFRIFVDTAADIRFIRRLRRDLSSRGRTIDSVIKQYETSVRPAYFKFVEPVKKFADVIVSGEGSFKEPVSQIFEKIRGRVDL